MEKGGVYMSRYDNKITQPKANKVSASGCSSCGLACTFICSNNCSLGCTGTATKKPFPRSNEMK